MADEAERRTERIPLLMTPSEVKALDDWAFANRIRSRGEAIRRLIKVGLSKTPTDASPAGGEPGKSDKPAGSVAPAPTKPVAPSRKAEPAPRSKLEQIRALREQGVG
jgi:hypothetical protein